MKRIAPAALNALKSAPRRPRRPVLLTVGLKHVFQLRAVFAKRRVGPCAAQGRVDGGSKPREACPARVARSAPRAQPHRKAGGPDFDPVLADVSDSGVLLVPIAAQTFACESVAELAEWVRRQEKSQTMMLIERARGRDEELDREWLEMGLEKGRREGREEGRLEGERELVRRLVARRFGRGAANDIVPLLASVSDSDRLTAIAAMVFTCETPSELAEWGRGNGAAE